MSNQHLKEFRFTPNDYGWTAHLPGTPRVFGHKVMLEIHTRLTPSEPAVLPPVSRSQASLVQSILPELPSIIQRVESELTAYCQEYEPEFRDFLHRPHIWLSSEDDDGASWTFVVGRTDNPDFGYDLLFNGIEFIELCGGD